MGSYKQLLAACSHIQPGKPELDSAGLRMPFPKKVQGAGLAGETQAILPSLGLSRALFCLFLTGFFCLECLPLLRY